MPLVSVRPAATKRRHAAASKTPTTPERALARAIVAAFRAGRTPAERRRALTLAMTDPLRQIHDAATKRAVMGAARYATGHRPRVRKALTGGGLRNEPPDIDALLARINELTSGRAKDNWYRAFDDYLRRPLLDSARWAETNAGRLATGLSSEETSAVRVLTRAAVAAGVPTDKLGILMRDAVGLSPVQQTALANIFRGVYEGSAVGDFAAASAAASAYADDALVYRADMIARTETLAAENAGLIQGWQDAASAGYVDTSQARVVWNTGDDPCSECATMADRSRSFDGNFSYADTKAGSLSTYSSDYNGDQGPPLHPMCRCTMDLQSDAPISAALNAMPQEAFDQLVGQADDFIATGEGGDAFLGSLRAATRDAGTVTDEAASSLSPGVRAMQDVIDSMPTGSSFDDVEAWRNQNDPGRVMRELKNELEARGGMTAEEIHNETEQTIRFRSAVSSWKSGGQSSLRSGIKDLLENGDNGQRGPTWALWQQLSAAKDNPRSLERYLNEVPREAVDWIKSIEGQQYDLLPTGWTTDFASMKSKFGSSRYGDNWVMDFRIEAGTLPATPIEGFASYLDEREWIVWGRATIQSVVLDEDTNTAIITLGRGANDGRYGIGTFGEGVLKRMTDEYLEAGKRAFDRAMNEQASVHAWLTSAQQSGGFRKSRGWIGVDLDNTLSYDSYGNSADTGRSPGEPVPRMLDQVRRWLDDGWEVRIFTARHSMPDGTEKDDVVSMIQDWTERHLGVRLPVTCKKDQDMVALFDDRAYHVVPNTGQIVPTPEPGAIAKSDPSSSDVHVDGPLSSAVGFPKNPRKSRPTVIRRIRPR